MHFYPFMDAYSMFFIYAFIGWVVEVIYYGFEEGKFINRGFLNGPLCPVYGIGFYGVILLLEMISKNFLLMFFGSMAICTFVEFWAGFLLLKIFDLRWWDYRNEKYNFMGLICPKFSMYWGFACSFGIFVLHPTVLWLLEKTPDLLQIILLCVFTGIMISDIITTVLAIIGFKKRLGFITGISGEMKAISDRIGGSIYGRVDTVRTKSQPTLENYGVWRTVYNEHRKEERALARKHRAEEKALFGELFPKMDPSSIHPREAIANRVASAVKSLKAPERRILRTVYTNMGEYGKTAFDNLAKLLPFAKKTDEESPSDEENRSDE